MSVDEGFGPLASHAMETLREVEGLLAWPRGAPEGQGAGKGLGTAARSVGSSSRD